MSYLTERLAAKMTANDFGVDVSRWAALWSDVLLPLLLSEPELVAGLADEVRLSVLTERERAVMKLGEGVANVSGKIRLDLSVTVDNALAEVRALTPEVGND